MKVATVVLQVDGRDYTIENDEWSDDADDNTLIFMFTDGNYGCDCNKSLFLHRKFDEVPETGCGDRIKLVSLRWMNGPELLGG